MWSNLPRKTAIATTFYFAAEEKSVIKRKKSVSLIARGTILIRAFCNTCSNFHMEKTGPCMPKISKIDCHIFVVSQEWLGVLIKATGTVI